MKKRFYALLLCIVLSATIFSGCGKTSEANLGNNTQVSDNNYDSDEGFPLLEDDLIELYKDTETLYSYIVFGSLKYDTSKKIEKDNLVYYKVNEPAFESYDSFKTYLSNYFTEDFINREILSPDSIRFIQDENGDLYMMNGSRGENVFYAGHVFHPAEIEENQISFTATAYYTNKQEPYDGQLFYTEPENNSDFSTQDFTFTLVKEGDSWKFDRFSCFF
ncbi:DL-endopeptidase inhibitor IseA family protein [Anaerotignum sp. MB30-C6]|uniref:DL-endopeptidase inhibitor IseA family protein n=1 Tax=Anaerotignum sp. MB30-C6 TaxID=3070814 RepID=UPI0027DC3AA7|nr:DL-endopeptidase inhibitor IseA family protein [Anaerotignum sp. MB30-C6]WMI81110.1 DL-endopeptidase inhibitor IseA family protein [Anaerotignum sp. MB30-C6]